MNIDMQAQVESIIQVSPKSREKKPYPPSFVDRIMSFFKRSPRPYWLTYLVLFILQSIIVHILAWADGAVSAYTFYPVALVFPMWLWGPLAMMTYLNTVAHKTLLGFSPVLDIDEDGLEKLDYEFTTMPNHGVLISGVLWSIIYGFLTYLGYEAFYASFGLDSLLTWVFIIEGLASFLIGSAIYYQSLRQLKHVNRTVKMVKQFDLFQLEPVYAFSRLTSRIGIFWIILISLTLALFPFSNVNAAILVVWAFQVVLALAAFVLPLGFVNRYLVAEKLRMLSELDLRNKQTLERLHRSLDEDNLPEAVQLNNVLTGLNTEYNVLNRIPTWPWRSSTLTSFISAVGLPIVIFLIQLAIKNLLGD